MRRLITGLVLALVAALTAGPAAAAGDHRYYGDSARQVARQIGCKAFRSEPVGAELRPYVKSSGLCAKNGRRFAVFTFGGPKKQKTLETLFYLGAKPREYWASGRGALIMGPNANRPAARLGARLLHGRVMHG